MSNGKIDNALQALLNMADVKVLWENASIDSAFSAQDITIPNLNSQKLILIGMYSHEDTDFNVNTFEIFARKNQNCKLSSAGFIYNNKTEHRAATAQRRFVVEGNTLKFKEAYRTIIPDGAFTIYQDNQLCKPYIIYGIGGGIN